MDVDSTLVTIGTFSMLTGLSIPTLRHYDEIGLLRPYDVDARSGYRRYSHAQVATGRRIRLLREADLSIDDIGRLVDAEVTDVRDALVRQRAAFQDRGERIDTVIRRLVTSGADLGSVDDTGYPLDRPHDGRGVVTAGDG